MAMVNAQAPRGSKTPKWITSPSTYRGPPLPLPPAPPHVVTQIQGGPGAGFPDPDDFYPALARYREEQGVATVRVCVDAHGRLTSDPATLQGSGSAFRFQMKN
jgi:hypothetical protein